MRLLKTACIGLIWLFICTQHAHAQGFPSKGASIIKGNLGFSYSESKLKLSGTSYFPMDFKYENSTTSYMLALVAEGSFLLNDNFFVGGTLAATLSDRANQAIQLGPHLGYAFGKSTDPAIPYVSAGAGITYNDDGDLGYHANGKLGCLFKLKKHIALDVGLQGTLVFIETSGFYGSSGNVGQVINVSVGLAGLLFKE